MQAYAVPIWLRNAEYMYSLPTNHEDRLHVLWYFSGLAANWIDNNRIEGNRGNYLIARRALRLFSRIADFSLLRPNDQTIEIAPKGGGAGIKFAHPLFALRSIVVRLKGLL